MIKPLDLNGQTFGRLTVLNRDGSQGSKARWLCLCVCGNTVLKTSNDLTSGNTRSCGCLRREMTAQKLATHGQTNSPEYRTWSKMKERVNNPSLDGYENYGGRGIRVDPEWENSFENFLDDMGPRPSAKHSIERVDNDGDYVPENCKWATQTEQVRNRRNTVRLDYCGRKVTLAELSEICGLSYMLLYKRIVISGWAIEDALRP